MTAVTLKHPKLLEIVQPERLEYGCNQERFSHQWGRFAGCGPTITATITGYRRWRGARESVSAEEWLALMDDVWEDVKPGARGLPSVRDISPLISKYLRRADPGAVIAHLDIPGINGLNRPTFDEFLSFIENTLLADVPVAFLTLDKAGLITLDDWHWTIIAALRESGGRVFAENYNCGYRFNVDLRQWFDNTKMGGALLTIL